MTEGRKGILAMIAACTIWGLSPQFYKAIAEVPAVEVLCHRTVWSALFFGLVLMAQGRLGAVPGLLRGRRLILVAFAALMISTNWFLFIFAVQIGHAVQSSLGYYIYPLFAVVLGVLVFGERLSPGQGIAVAMAALAVAILTWGLGEAPWLALFLAITFALYGLVKKQIDAGPVVSVTAEVMLLTPLALAWLVGVHGGFWHDFTGQPGGWFGSDWTTSLLLVFSGAITGGPMILFSYASKRITMAAVGITQYLNPTLQFLGAALIFREPLTVWHMAAFTLIWAAVLIFSAAALRQDRLARRAVASASTSATAMM